MKAIFTGDINFLTLSITPASAKQILSQVQPVLDAADIRFGNLETPLATEELYEPIIKCGPNLICPPNDVIFLKSAGFQAVTIANNHLGDFGEEALYETLKVLDENDIGYTGSGRNISEAYQAYRFSRKGISVSVLATCENEFGMATDTKGGTAGLNMLRLFNRIKEEKAISDFVVIVHHGGNEYNPLPSPKAVDRYRLFVEFGADAVVATHTHCPQGYEVYKGAPIVYSMGNFLFCSTSGREQTDSWHYGYMAQLDFEKGNRIGLELIPYRFLKDGSLIELFTGENKTAMLDYLDKLSEVIQDSEQLRCYFKGWCFLHPWMPYVAEDADFESLEGRISRDRNLLSCEAHNEQAREMLRMINDGEIPEAKLWAEKITELQQMPVRG